MESKARAGSCCWGRTKGQSRREREGERDQGWMRPVPHHTHTHLSPAELNGESPLGPKSTDSLTNYLPREKRGGLELSEKSQKRAINRRQWQFLNRERFVSTQAAFSFSPSPSIPLPSVFLLPSLCEAINQIQSRKRKAQRKPLVEKKEKEKKERGQQSAGSSSQINVTNLETLQTHCMCCVVPYACLRLWLWHIEVVI